MKTGGYLVVIFMAPIVLSIIAPFFDVPALKKSGKLVYHSLLFIAERPKNGVIKIHGGTLFDYVFVLDKKMTGTQRTNFILQQYVQGLLSLIETYQAERNDHLIIRGTSYFMNERTARKMGFKTTKTDLAQKLTLLLNYCNVLVTYSVGKHKLSFPNLNHTSTVEASLADLVTRKEYIKNLNNRLMRTGADTPLT